MIMEKEVFERMLLEFEELNEKVTKCREFLLNEEKSEKLDALNRDLLVAQLKSMESYLSILSIRIGLNAPKEQELLKIASQALDDKEMTTSEVVND
jgi:hypothetical protein